MTDRPTNRLTAILPAAANGQPGDHAAAARLPMVHAVELPEPIPEEE